MVAPFIVFDVDGTLIDSQHTIVGSMQGAFTAFGLPVPDHLTIRRTVGLPVEDAVHRLAEAAALGLATDTVHQVAEEYKRRARSLRERPDYHEPMFDGTRPLLDGLLAAGQMMGIATGKSRRGLDTWIAKTGLAGHFVTLQTGDIPPGKPHPAMLHRAMDEAGARAADTLMIGDTVFDVQMAVAAGARAIGVAWGYHAPEELLEAGAERILTRWEDLLAGA